MNGTSVHAGSKVVDSVWKFGDTFLGPECVGGIVSNSPFGGKHKASEALIDAIPVTFHLPLFSRTDIFMGT